MKILVVDDHSLIRSGLKSELAQLGDGIQIVEADDGRSALEALENGDGFTLALVDLFIPGEEGFEFIRNICDHYPSLPVIIISSSENPLHVRKALDLGAVGFIPKSSSHDTLLGAIDKVLAGGIYIPDCATTPLPLSNITIEYVRGSLTERQFEILASLSEGMSNRQIAAKFQLSENTIKVHLSAIFKALGLSNRTQAGVLVQQLGLFDKN